MIMSHRKGGILRILLIVLIVLIVIGAAAVYLVVKNLDRIAEVAITQGMSFILNVPVKLDKADIDLKSGSIELDNLVIENPRGFQQERAFSLGRIYVQADVNSFRSDLPVINRITIEDPQITLEYGLKGSNFDQLIENANRFSRQGKRGRESGSAKERKKGAAGASPEEIAEMSLLVKKFDLNDANVNLAASAFSLQKEYGLDLPAIEIDNIGGKDVTTAEVTRHVLKEILHSILQSKNMPSDFADLAKDPKAYLEARATHEVNKALDKGKDELNKALEKGKDHLTGELDKLAGDNEMLGKAVDQGKKALDDALGDGQGKLDSLIDKNADKLSEEAKKKAEEKAKKELEKLKKKFGW